MNRNLDRAPVKPDRDESDIEVVLAALRFAEPEPGLEQRVLHRLAGARTDAAHASWPERLTPPRLAGLAACALCLLCTAAALLHYGQGAQPGLAGATGSVPVKQMAAVPTTSAAASRQLRTLNAVAISREASGPAQHAARGKSCLACGEDARTSSATAIAPAAETASAHQPGFPAPPMPLTEQEKLLLRIAHRNDPVEVAMLDPVARDLQLARERAASARFFAPPALPAELQQQIDAALRSQYVNTPPPRELLAQTADRSQP